MAKYAFLVEVTPQYLPDQSAPDDGLYVFAYTITITNTGGEGGPLGQGMGSKPVCPTQGNYGPAWDFQ